MHARTSLPRLLVLALLGLPAALGAQQPITSRDLWSMARVGSPALSPDGSTVLYTVTIAFKLQ